MSEQIPKWKEESIEDLMELSELVNKIDCGNGMNFDPSEEAKEAHAIISELKTRVAKGGNQ
jgi:hypothetical protein